MLSNEAPWSSRANGTDLAPRQTDEAMQGRRAIMNSSMALAQVVKLMMQSPNHRHFSISDLEWMVLPALSTGQLAMAETKPDQAGFRQPLAVLFWASVSPEIDQRLSANLDAPVRLSPDEWRSGDILWVTDMIGDMSTGHALVKSVLDSILAGRTAKVRSMDPNGRRVLLEINSAGVKVLVASQPDSCSSHSRSCPPSGMLCASCVTTGCTGRCRQGKAADGGHLANH